MPLELVNSRNALSYAGSDDLQFSDEQSILRTGFWPEQFGAGIDTFWIRVVDDTDAFPPEF